MAMLFAMHARFTIVVLPLIATVSPADRPGWDELHNVMAAAVARTGGEIDTMPVFVCAGGNFVGNPMRLPATLPGAVVVRATDWSRELASYNSRAPVPPPCLVNALGGERDRPLGRRGAVGVAATECYGTSFSTALVAGTLVPGS
jgi:hypothetical protein